MEKENRKFKWIFFDLDGTLADSLPAMYKLHLDFLAKFGITGNKEEFEELNGPSIPEVVAILKKRYQLTESEINLIKLYKSGMTAAYRNYLKPFSDVIPVLKDLKDNGYQLSLVTSADQELAESFLINNRLSPYFKNYVFGNEVRKAKPDPAIYQLALQRTGASPDLVAVVEDSYNGVKSAKAAGAFVFGFVNNQTKDDLLKAGANVTIFSLKEIPLLLGV